MKYPIANLVLTALLLSIISISSVAQNIALNKPVTVSSVQSGTSYTGNLAVDGNSSKDGAVLPAILNGSMLISAINTTLQALT